MINDLPELPKLSKLMLDVNYQLLDSNSNSFREEIIEWCHQTIKGSVNIIKLTHVVETETAIKGTKIHFDIVRYVFEFENESDMIAFKLRWL